MSSPLTPRFLPGAPAWAEGDSVSLRDFLQTPSGQNLMRSLLHSRPEVSAREGERRHIEQDERTGYEACIHDILTLADPNLHVQPTA